MANDIYQYICPAMFQKQRNVTENFTTDITITSNDLIHKPQNKYLAIFHLKAPVHKIHGIHRTQQKNQH